MSPMTFALMTPQEQKHDQRDLDGRKRSRNEEGFKNKYQDKD